MWYWEVFEQFAICGHFLCSRAKERKREALKLLSLSASDNHRFVCCKWFIYIFRNRSSISVQVWRLQKPHCGCIDCNRKDPYSPNGLRDETTCCEFRVRPQLILARYFWTYLYDWLSYKPEMGQYIIEYIIWQSFCLLVRGTDSETKKDTRAYI